MDFAHEGDFSAKKASGIGLTIAVHVLVACGLIYGLHHSFTRPPPPPGVDYIDSNPPVPKTPPSATVPKFDPAQMFPMHRLDPPPVGPVDQSDTSLPKANTGLDELPGRVNDDPGKSDGGSTQSGKLASAPVIANLEGCKPEYPRSSVLGEESGVVRVRFEIGADSRLISASVLKSSGYRALDKATLNGLSQCQFKAATQEGVPVSSTLVTEYVWTLKGE